MFLRYKSILNKSAAVQSRITGKVETVINYTLFGTCKLSNVNPQDWLLDVLQKLPARKANNIVDLLPQNWNPCIQGVVWRVLTFY
jgi:hypothetical protein